jgi:hypothetical protein
VLGTCRLSDNLAKGSSCFVVWRSIGLTLQLSLKLAVMKKVWRVLQMDNGRFCTPLRLRMAVEELDFCCEAESKPRGKRMVRIGVLMDKEFFELG